MALKALTANQRDSLNWWYVDQGRRAQVPPPPLGWDSERASEWIVWLIMAGRGFGKTRSGAEWIIERAKQGLGPIALIGETAGDVRDTMIELGPSSILKISDPGFMPEYEPSKRRLTWPNGVVATAFSGEKPDQLRGPQHQTVWADEPAKWKYAAETWDQMEFGLRVGDPKVCATTTPRPVDLIKRLVDDRDVIITGGSSYENEQNLSKVYKKRTIYRFEGTRLGRQELEAELLTDTPGALWKLDLIDDLRLRPDDQGNRPQPPAMVRIVIAVDPATTTGEDSDETGIIVAGLGVDGHAYVLEDRSGKYSPNEWRQKVSTAYLLHEADRVIGETNQGGDLVEDNIRTADSSISFGRVHAKRSKQLRAEPVAALYEQRRVHHVGAFPELEDQMTTWTPGSDSPDRLDALVYALRALLVEREEEGGVVVVS